MKMAMQNKPSLECVEDISRVNVNTSENNSYIPLSQSIKKWPRIVGYCLALSSAILLYGYDLVIVGTVAAMPQFQYTSQPLV
jgi:hypothetical protein